MTAHRHTHNSTIAAYKLYPSHNALSKDLSTLSYEGLHAGLACIFLIMPLTCLTLFRIFQTVWCRYQISSRTVIPHKKWWKMIKILLISSGPLYMDFSIASDLVSSLRELQGRKSTKMYMYARPQVQCTCFLLVFLVFLKRSAWIVRCSHAALDEACLQFT